jgi:hypothetical protein
MPKIITFFIIALNVFHADTVRQEEHFIPYHLLPGSRLWIDGTSTVNTYRCETVAVYGSGDLNEGIEKFQETPSSRRADTSSARVIVYVRMFNCGNNAMNADMYHALRAETDSTIHYTLSGAQVLYDSTVQHGWLGLQTIGTLSIAGVTRSDTINVRVKSLSNSKYEITGRKKLSMRDFHIIPPSAFFGLIKADEALVVNFDLIAGPDHNVTDHRESRRVH